VKRQLVRCPRLLTLDPIGGPWGWDDSCALAQDWEALYEAVGRARFRVSARIDDPDGNTYVLERAAEIVRAVENCTLVVEEVTRFLPKRADPPEYIVRLFQEGRRELVNVFCLTQRPAHVPTDLRALFTDIYAFSIMLPQDIDWLSDVMGKDVALRLKKLTWHQCYHWNIRTHQSVLISKERRVKYEHAQDGADRRGGRGGDLSGNEDPGDPGQLPRLDRLSERDESRELEHDARDEDLEE
jgi:hypothetical protein